MKVGLKLLSFTPQCLKNFCNNFLSFRKYLTEWISKGLTGCMNSCMHTCMREGAGKSLVR